MIALNIDDLRVDSFTTIDGGTGVVPFTAPEAIDGYDLQPLYMPVTAHTDPCDDCCNGE